MFTDDRLAEITPSEAATIMSAVFALDMDSISTPGSALVALQRAQREARNTPDGYWIAEADPDSGPPRC